MIVVHAHDVILGKGKGSYNHKGNIIFRKLIDQYKNQYVSCKKVDKRNLAICITNAIRSQDPPGRFLEIDTSVGTVGSWIEVDNERAINKTCQTLRKKRNNTGSTILSNSMKMKSQDSSRSNDLLSVNGFCSKSSPLGSSSLSSIEYVPYSFSQLPGDKKNEGMHATFLENNVTKGQNSNSDLSAQNEVILANLQRCYHVEKEWSSFGDHIYRCQDDIHKAPSSDEIEMLNEEDFNSDSKELFISNIGYLTQDNDEFDDEILRVIIDLDHDSTITNDLTSSTNSTKICASL